MSVLLLGGLGKLKRHDLFSCSKRNACVAGVVILVLHHTLEHLSPSVHVESLWLGTQFKWHSQQFHQGARQ